jgi:hypothetical protein
MRNVACDLRGGLDLLLWMQRQTSAFTAGHHADRFEKSPSPAGMDAGGAARRLR